MGEARTHLTQPGGPASLNAMMSAMPSGMAWIAGTGPDGETCRTCAHWMRTKPSLAAYNREGHYPELKPKPCAMYRKLMLRGALDVTGAPVPAKAMACRHFEPLPDDVEAAPLSFAVFEKQHEKAKADRAAARKIKRAADRKEKASKR